MTASPSPLTLARRARFEGDAGAPRGKRAGRRPRARPACKHSTRRPRSDCAAATPMTPGRPGSSPRRSARWPPSPRRLVELRPGTRGGARRARRRGSAGSSRPPGGLEPARWPWTSTPPIPCPTSQRRAAPRGAGGRRRLHDRPCAWLRTGSCGCGCAALDKDAVVRAAKCWCATAVTPAGCRLGSSAWRCAQLELHARHAGRGPARARRGARRRPRGAGCGPGARAPLRRGRGAPAGPGRVAHCAA